MTAALTTLASNALAALMRSSSVISGAFIFLLSVPTPLLPLRVFLWLCEGEEREDGRSKEGRYNVRRLEGKGREGKKREGKKREGKKRGGRRGGEEEGGKKREGGWEDGEEKHLD